MGEIDVDKDWVMLSNQLDRFWVLSISDNKQVLIVIVKSRHVKCTIPSMLPRTFRLLFCGPSQKLNQT